MRSGTSVSRLTSRLEAAALAQVIDLVGAWELRRATEEGLHGREAEERARLMRDRVLAMLGGPAAVGDQLAATPRRIRRNGGALQRALERSGYTAARHAVLAEINRNSGHTRPGDSGRWSDAIVEAARAAMEDLIESYPEVLRSLRDDLGHDERELAELLYAQALATAGAVSDSVAAPEPIDVEGIAGELVIHAKEAGQAGQPKALVVVVLLVQHRAVIQMLSRVVPAGPSLDMLLARWDRAMGPYVRQPG